jgi:predicted  nucleic acid-binding Zn-ribbon protein
MSDIVQFSDPSGKKKSFWSRPEGVTGMVFMGGVAVGVGYLLVTFGAAILQALTTTIGIAIALGVLALLVYMVLDPRMRTLVWYMYKSVMRGITGIFVTLDPIGILKNYISDLEDNLRKMSKQIGALRGQMRKLKNIVAQNEKDIDLNLKMANRARDQQKQQQMILSSRKAARLKESNEKYTALHNRMEVMHRILSKMYSNSEILLEDTRDQVAVKEQERKAIRTSHSAMKSAMSVISGDPDKREMFDRAMEAVADDVANKVGEMERFMEMSASFMDSVDLQNGVFEEEGLRMLEKWEEESTLLLMGENTSSNLLDAGLDDNTFDLNQPRSQPQKQTRTNKGDNNYDTFFE